MLLPRSKHLVRVETKINTEFVCKKQELCDGVYIGNSRGDRGIMGHGELRTSVIFLKTVSNYCPKTFFFEFSYSSPIFGTPVELRTSILTEL